MTGLVLTGLMCACPCTLPPGGVTAQRELAYATAARVVLGPVVAVDTIVSMQAGLPPRQRTEPRVLRYRLVVEKQWKGAPADTLALIAPDQGTSCGRSLSVGTQYVIYLDDAAEPEIGRCTRAVAGTDLSNEVAWLRNRAAPSTK